MPGEIISYQGTLVNLKCHVSSSQQCIYRSCLEHPEARIGYQSLPSQIICRYEVACSAGSLGFVVRPDSSVWGREKTKRVGRSERTNAQVISAI